MESQMMRENSGGEKSSLSMSKDTKIDYVRDAAYAIQMSRRILTVIGLWRVGEVEKFSKRFLLSNVSMMIYYCAITIRFIPMVAYTIFDARTSYVILNMICRTWYSFMAGSKYIFLHYHARDIADCMSHIETDWMTTTSSVSREKMSDYVQFGNRMTKLYAFVSLSGACWFAILPFFLKKTPPVFDDQNGTLTFVETPRVFPIPSNFGFSAAKKTPYFEIICVTQLIATFLLHSMQISAYNVAVAIVMHTCGQLNILMNKIGKLTDTTEESEAFECFSDKLSDIVKHHVRTLRFMSNGGKLMREICLIDLGSCTVQICFSAYFGMANYRAATRNVVGLIVCVIFFITFTFNVFSICYIGELLTQECEKVGQVAYMTNWHNFSGKQHLGLCLIIAMSQSPAILTAGGTIPLTFACFANVMKTSMGYLNMLRTVTE